MRNSRLALLGIMAIMTIVSSNLNWTRGHWKFILQADAKGYYAYLPATFIYHDLNFGFFDHIEREKYHDPDLFYDYRADHEGQTINKYYCGTALAQLPFFLTAHLVTRLTGLDLDGYSRWYMISVNLAALFYLWLGLLFLLKLLETYSISQNNQALTLLSLAFGTNLFYYTVGEPGLSHIVSFAAIASFLWTIRAYFSDAKNNHLILLGLLLGVIVLIRPVNGLVLLLVPFLAGSKKRLSDGLQTLKSRRNALLLSLLTMLMVISIQLVIYKISAGSFLIYSYGEEGFNFLDPHIYDILFSYRKGLFVYTPMYLLSLGGLWYLHQKSVFLGWTALGFFFILTYILSSWWMWYYGGSFSSRVFVEYLPFFGVSLAFLLNETQRQKRHLVMIMIFVLIVICQIQTYQYRYYEIHWSEMTKEAYWDVFLRIDRLIR